MNMRKIRFIRHVVLFFAVGFSWGLVSKYLANNFLYIGHDDPQVQLQVYSHEIEPILRDQSSGDGLTGDPTHNQSTGEQGGELEQVSKPPDTADVAIPPQGGRLQI